MIALGFVTLAGPAALAQDSRQATGVKVGEVTATSAIVWMRLTKDSTRRTSEFVHFERFSLLPEGVEVDELPDSSPGAFGRVRLRYGTDPELDDAEATDWVDVGPKTDFTHQFRLEGLKPSTTYYYSAETTGPGGGTEHAPLPGQFSTAPRPDEVAEVTFTAITCLGYQDLDHPDGFAIYQAMTALDPAFFCSIGDNVYYDNDGPMAQTLPIARYHWQRMHNLPRHVAFHLRFPGFWLKDDHDTLIDDTYPGDPREQKQSFRFEDGVQTFVEQVPMKESTYRTARWGQDVQLWFVEGRDFRSPNKAPDGPDKTILGPEQKAWLKRTMLESDATWKILVSPTPIVGPDRERKADNHANAAFAHEGDEIRNWFREHLPENAFVVCGDRHWQYHSVHPETGLQEFSVGAASDEHAQGSPGEDPDYHRFHLVKGGFLSVHVARPDGQPTIDFRHHDVDGKIVYEHRFQRPENE